MVAILDKMLPDVGYDQNFEVFEGTEPERFSIKYLEFQWDHHELKHKHVSQDQTLSVTKPQKYSSSKTIFAYLTRYHNLLKNALTMKQDAFGYTITDLTFTLWLLLALMSVI